MSDIRARPVSNYRLVFFVAGLILLAFFLIWWAVKSAGPGRLIEEAAPAVSGVDASKLVPSAGADGKAEPAVAVHQADRPPSAVRDWRDQLARAGAPSQRMEFIHENIADLSVDQARSLLTAAMRDADREVRREALNMARQLAEGDSLPAVLELAFQDSDALVRDRAFQFANDLSLSVRLPLFVKALSGSNEQSALRAASQMGSLGAWVAADALVNAWPSLADSFPTRGGAVREALQHLTGESFANPAQALHWWAKSSVGLDKDLLPKEP